MLRLGLAGLGIHGSRYARHLLRGDVPGARLVAVSRRDAREGHRFAEEHGLAFVPDPVQLASHPEVDAVAVALYPDLHAAVAGSALEQGKPALVEKPMAADVPSARALERRSVESGVPLMVAQTLRFNALVNAVRREVHSLGPIRLVSVGQHLADCRCGRF